MKILGLIMALCLTACGSSSSSSSTTPPIVTEPPVVVAPADPFYTTVNLAVGDAAETTNEPADIATAAITEPENSEPTTL
jgi:ABC-type Zn uptake system ZnuABC Zn-binding protein ZnuA